MQSAIRISTQSSTDSEDFMKTEDLTATSSTLSTFEEHSHGHNSYSELPKSNCKKFTFDIGDTARGKSKIAEFNSEFSSMKKETSRIRNLKQSLKFFPVKTEHIRPEGRPSPSESPLTNENQFEREARLTSNISWIFEQLSLFRAQDRALMTGLLRIQGELQQLKELRPRCLSDESEFITRADELTIRDKKEIDLSMSLQSPMFVRRPRATTVQGPTSPDTEQAIKQRIQSALIQKNSIQKLSGT